VGAPDLRGAARGLGLAHEAARHAASCAPVRQEQLSLPARPAGAAPTGRAGIVLEMIAPGGDRRTVAQRQCQNRSIGNEASGSHHRRHGRGSAGIPSGTGGCLWSKMLPTLGA
jgi:hypothetical protein